MVGTQRSKIALVTGANRGLGREIAKRLIERSINVILCARNYEEAVKTASEIDPGGVLAHPQRLDVLDEQSISTVSKLVEARFKTVDILINNAGVYLDDPRKFKYDSILELPLADLETTMNVNFMGPARVIWAFLPGMKARNFGRIINVSSGMARFDDFDTDGPFYRISKTALNALTKLVAAEVSEFDILVNAVCPGWIRTAMGGKEAPLSASQAAAEIVSLCLAECGSVTGKFIRAGVQLDWCRK